MQVEITRTHKTKELVEVEIPYFFEADHGGDDYTSMMYGRIEAKRTTKITIGGSHGALRAEVEVTECQPSTMSCYLTEEYKSTAAAYEKARATALELLALPPSTLLGRSIG